MFGHLLLIFISVYTPAQAPEKPSLDTITEALQDRHDTIKDFSADFVHTYEGALLRTKTTERGTVLIKKPGKVKWSYKHPEEKLFISDGLKIYSYIPSDNQVIVSNMPSGEAVTPLTLFLIGKNKITDNFVVSYEENQSIPPDTYAISLIPRQNDPSHEQFTLIIDSVTFQIRQLITHDFQGGTSVFVFTNLMEDTGLSDEEFLFEIPEGSEIITSNR